MTPLHIGFAILVSLLWGGNFVAAKLALHELPPFLLLGVRFLLASAALLPFFFTPLARAGASAAPISFRQILPISFFLGTAHFGMMFGAIWLGLDASGAVIASQLGVPFSCLLGAMLMNDPLGKWRSFGMLISFFGVVLIAGTPRMAEQFWPFLLGCVASLAWGVSNIQMKRLGEAPILPLLARISAYCAPQFFLLSLLFESGQTEHLRAASATTWLAMTYTVLGSTVVAYGLWYYLLARFPVSQVAPYSLLVPIFGIGAAQWFFAEPMTPQFIVGGVLTMLGVAVILVRRPRLGALER